MRSRYHWMWIRYHTALATLFVRFDHSPMASHHMGRWEHHLNWLERRWSNQLGVDL